MRTLWAISICAALAACGGRGMQVHSDVAEAQAPASSSESGGADVVSMGDAAPVPSSSSDAATIVAAPNADPSDADIADALRAAFRHDAELGEFVIDVDSKDGLVILSGVTASEAAKRRAGDFARAMPRVQAVSDQLTVKRG
ncbi:BON domain-containing protein [Ramlibacter sp.]|uniref:BON domain-containing protein n=1 Tax=Ramlibacter sp. TaxID=1917967 RepID=UPI003D135387